MVERESSNIVVRQIHSSHVRCNGALFVGNPKCDCEGGIALLPLEPLLLGVLWAAFGTIDANVSKLAKFAKPSFAAGVGPAETGGDDTANDDGLSQIKYDSG